MDFTDAFPGSWPLVRKNLPALLGAGVGAIAGSLAAGRRAYKQVQLDNRVKFPTWTERKMPGAMKRRFNIRRRSAYRRRRPFTKRGMSSPDKRIVRSSGILTLTQTASLSAVSSQNVTLSQISTTDLTGIYSLYRIRKVVCHLTPRVDSANSGLANNFVAMVATACDSESTAAPSDVGTVTAYDNSYSKFIKAGTEYRYTFYPKVTNSVDVSGTATAAGSYGMNPWLRLDATGITVPHLSLKIATRTGASTTLNYDYYYDIHFDVRGIH